jgi:cytoskeletal protein CcmA (bactofilin family)
LRRLLDNIGEIRHRLGAHLQVCSSVLVQQMVITIFDRKGLGTEDRRMAGRADDDILIKPVPLLPPRAVPPRISDLLPARAPLPPSQQTDPSGGSRETEPRNLIVGFEVLLSGEISSCDRLIIEGNVEANLHDCHDVDIAETGFFKGVASIDNAEVRGRFEGELVVRKRLLIRATGRVSGKIAYSDIEIEYGGKISGEVEARTGDAVVSARPRGRQAASAV